MFRPRACTCLDGHAGAMEAEGEQHIGSAQAMVGSSELHLTAEHRDGGTGDDQIGHQIEGLRIRAVRMCSRR